MPSVTIRPTPARWHCSVRAVKDAFRQDIKSGSDQRNLAPMFDQRPNRQQNHTFLGWEKAARAHATAASGTGYSILHEDRGRSSQALAKPLRSSCVGLSDVSLFGECSLRARSGQSGMALGEIMAHFLITSLESPVIKAAREILRAAKERADRGN